jgi:hypothetical protein
MQMLFLLQLPGSDSTRKQRLRSQLASARATPALRQAHEDAARAFCEGEKRISESECRAALSIDSLSQRLGPAPGREQALRRIHIRLNAPLLAASRPALARYMSRSGASEAFTFASQFSANVSDDEAYVVSNVVRGLTGRAIFSADYAAVVTRSDEENPAKRDTLENDKANLLRAVNNGGTLVGRFTVPFYARSGATGSSALGVTVSGGILGPVGQSDESKRTSSFSGAVEGLGSLAIRNLSGNAEQTAELILGVRTGYTRAGRALSAASGFRDIGFIQSVIGLRQNGTMTVSALVTVVNHEFDKSLPKLVLNFSALR